MLVIAVVIGFLLTFGIFLMAVAVAILDGQRSNRQEMKALANDFERIAERLRERRDEWP